MDIKKIILLAGALIVAGITAFVARGMFASGNAPEANAQIAQQQQGVEVLVATRTMPVGTIVDPTAFRYQPWPKDIVDAGVLLTGSAQKPQSDRKRVVQGERVTVRVRLGGP